MEIYYENKKDLSMVFTDPKIWSTAQGSLVVDGEERNAY